MDRIKNIVTSIIILLAAVYIGGYMRYFIYDVFFHNVSFPLSFGWIDWMSVINWGCYLVFFIMLGFVLSATLSQTRITPWSISFGIVYSVITLYFSVSYFSGETEWWVYFWAYGFYIVPPIGSYIGAILLIKLRRIISSNKSLNLTGANNAPPS